MRTAQNEGRERRSWRRSWARIESELRGDNVAGMHQQGYGFSKFFELLIGCVAIIATTFLGWACVTLVALKEDVAVLKNRPAPVSQEAFNYRLDSVERRLSALEAQRERGDQ